MENIVQGSILGDQLPQFAQDLGVPQDMEFSVLKLGKSQAQQDELATLPTDELLIPSHRGKNYNKVLEMPVSTRLGEMMANDEL